MISVESAIQRVRRDITLATVVKVAFFVAILGSLMIGPPWLMMLTLGAVLFFWVYLSFNSARNSRIAADSSLLIASGQYDEAEQRIDQAISAFTLFRAAKLQALHHLAVLRHAQRRWQEAALLCRALLGQRLGPARNISRPARLMLADALLEMNDPRGAYAAIANLYAERLTLSEVLNLMLVQLDYESRLGAWQQMMHDAPTKAQLAELLPAPLSARAQALLALAARKSGRNDWADWLRQRAELLAEVQSLCAQRPVLWELWKKEGAGSGADRREMDTRGDHDKVSG